MNNSVLLSIIKKYDWTISKSSKMKKIYDLVDVVSSIDIGIHITGEDGCGKDMMAEHIHHKSGRKGKFVTVNPVILNDIAGSLGFTKVYDYFVSAVDGTIYIRDISSANHKLQEYLLNSIIKIEQEQGVNRAPRLISSTNKDLVELSRQNKFNQRLRDSFAIIINIPPLRERREDIEELIRIFLKEYGYYGRKSLQLMDEAHKTLLSYDWPGNIRQLSNVIYHSVNNLVNGVISLASLPKEVVQHRNGGMTASQNTLDELYKYAHDLLESGSHSEHIDPYSEYLKIIERPLIQASLDMTKGNRSQAAKLLNINRNTLHKKIKEYSIE